MKYPEHWTSIEIDMHELRNDVLHGRKRPSSEIDAITRRASELGSERRKLTKWIEALGKTVLDLKSLILEKAPSLSEEADQISNHVKVGIGLYWNADGTQRFDSFDEKGTIKLGKMGEDP